MSASLMSFIGIDIGGTNLRGALIDREGVISSRFRFPSLVSEGREPFLVRLCSGIAGLMEKAAMAGVPVMGIGIGVPGLIGFDGIIHSSLNLAPLEGLNLAATIEQRLNLPAHCGNDANLIALGEHRFGAGQGLDSFMVITVGTGLGSGLVLDGKLWEGSKGYAAEFGHITVEPDGFLCPCGNRGCLEQYASAQALFRESGGLSPEELDRRAREDDPESIRILNRMASYLGIALASLLNTLNLQGVFIGGGVSACYDIIEPVIIKTVRSRTFSLVSESVIIRKTALGDDAGLLGAALNAMCRLQGIGLCRS